METWSACHTAGMTAYEAAKAMGKSHVSAYKWAKKAGVKWRSLSSEEHADRIRAGMGKPKAVPCNTMGAKRDDRKAVPPTQERTGGRFWIVNNKTGERVHKASATGIYNHATIMGWTDWDWGQEP